MKKKIIAVFAALQLIVLAAFAQNTTIITGKVTDEKGEPLPFATVLLGNGNGAVTDFEGLFSVEILADEEGMEMTASSTGYSDQTALWTKDQKGKPMKFWLKAGIELQPIVVVYLKSCIEIEYCFTCWGGCYKSAKDKNPDAAPLAETPEISEANLSIFPNPFISTLNIEMEVPTPQNYLFHLYNESGQLVFAESRELEAGLQNIQLDLVQRHLPEGAYFLRISDDAGEIRTKRLVKVSP